MNERIKAKQRQKQRQSKLPKIINESTVSFHLAVVSVSIYLCIYPSALPLLLLFLWLCVGVAKGNRQLRLWQSVWQCRIELAATWRTTQSTQSQRDTETETKTESETLIDGRVSWRVGCGQCVGCSCGSTLYLRLQHNKIQQFIASCRFNLLLLLLLLC